MITIVNEVQGKRRKGRPNPMCVDNNKDDLTEEGVFGEGGWG